jgi:hypothetical protein
MRGCSCAIACSWSSLALVALRCGKISLRARCGTREDHIFFLGRDNAPDEMPIFIGVLRWCVGDGPFDRFDDYQL